MTLCPVPVEKDGLNVAYAMKKFAGAKLAYVTPPHQFPLGYTLSPARRQLLLKWVQQNERWIIEDDYDSEFRYQGNPLPSLQGLVVSFVSEYTLQHILPPAIILGFTAFSKYQLKTDVEKLARCIHSALPGC